MAPTVLLAQALVSEPTLLLLDEPTNHLDLDAIVWLEEFLESVSGRVVIVTHDRAFLQRVARRIIELDRGRLTSWPGDYRTFLEKKEAWLANEAVANDVFDKKLAQEEVWLRRGVKARRTRDEGRVRRLMAMRDERAARRTQAGSVRLDLGSADRSGHVVFEAEGISKSFGRACVVRDFSTRVMRGDRIGLVGPNGVGKTTVLRMLVGGLRPDCGKRRARHRTWRSRTSISSVRCWIPSARFSRRSATATIGSPSVDARGTSSAISRISCSPRARTGQGADAVRWRTQSAAAGPSADPAGERARPRRADERSGSGDAVGTRSRAHGFCGHDLWWSRTIACFSKTS
jgi:ABC-type multidrug transport system ATPase subunit